MCVRERKRRRGGKGKENRPIYIRFAIEQAKRKRWSSKPLSPSPRPFITIIFTSLEREVPYFLFSLFLLLFSIIMIMICKKRWWHPSIHWSKSINPFSSVCESHSHFKVATHTWCINWWWWWWPAHTSYTCFSPQWQRGDWWWSSSSSSFFSSFSYCLVLRNTRSPFFYIFLLGGGGSLSQSILKPFCSFFLSIFWDFEAFDFMRSFSFLFLLRSCVKKTSEREREKKKAAPSSSSLAGGVTPFLMFVCGMDGWWDIVSDPSTSVCLCVSFLNFGER